MKIKCWILVAYLFLTMMLNACQSEIEVDLPDYEPKLVVEGYIENGQPARVMLTRSVPFFQHIDINYVLNHVLVMDAVVTVTSSDGEMERLSFMPSGESPYMFAYVGNMRGKENTRYDLKIEWGGQTYTASTSIVHTFDLDTIGFYSMPDMLADTMRTIRLLMSDNPAEMNFYQFYVKVHGRKLRDNYWITTMPVAFDDATFNGLTFNFEVLRANPSSFLMPQMTEEEEQEYFRMTYRPGDTVYVKYGLIDFDSYQFWNTGGNNAALGQNPFTNPTPTISNIKGDNVTGVWCGYACKTAVLIYE
ncbi:MAG: DUF4249 domain-containing protein [Bacteroidales bacterium]|nr:DUF4249 domain-containing protein [Bacteroidales bacterium]